MKKFFLMVPSLLMFACASADPGTDDTSTEQDLSGRIDCSVVLCAGEAKCVMQGVPARPKCVEEPIRPGPSTCEQKIEPGLCKAYFPRWGFDQNKGQCVPFIYGGCGGNANNFPSEAACERSCEPRPLPNPCATVLCVPEQRCIVENVQCIQAPCLPRARCVDIEP